jgi:hypothetical protein
MTESERLAHYTELAVQFREWAKSETNAEAKPEWTPLWRRGAERFSTITGFAFCA